MDAILENLVRPLVARFGTALAAILLTYGLESHVVEPIVTWLSAGLLLAVDLLLARYYRKLAFWKAVEKKGFGPVVGHTSPAIWKVDDRPFDANEGREA